MTFLCNQDFFKKMQSRRTYVMGYWPIAANAKRPLEHYSKYLALSIEMLAEQNLYFYSGNNAVLSSITELCRQNSVNLTIDKLLLDDMPRRASMDVLVQRARAFGAVLREPPVGFCSEKGLVHFWRDLQQAGEDAFKKIFSIWHSKIDLLHRAAQLDRFGSDEFAWVDASVARFNHRRDGWDFREAAMVPGKISHYRSKLRKHGKQLALNASVLLGDKDAIAFLKEAYDKAFVHFLQENYPNDEETVLDSVVTEHPDRFVVITRPAIAAPLITPPTPA